MEKKYEAPEAKIVILNISDPLAQVIPIGGDASGDGDAKESTVFEEDQEDEALPVDKNIWAEDEEE